MQNAAASPGPLGRNDAERLRLERSWVENSASRDLTAEEYASWSTLRSSHRVVVTDRTKLIAWRLFAGAPSVQDTFLVSGYASDIDQGCRATLIGDKKVHVVRHSPTMLLPGLFIWVPHFSDIRYTPSQGNRFSTKFSLVFKMEANPANKVEGPLYLSEASAFQEMWKGV